LKQVKNQNSPPTQAAAAPMVDTIGRDAKTARQAEKQKKGKKKR